MARGAQGLTDLHHGDGFVIPNAWDAGSARILEGYGFPALATTSAGIAWSCGIPDGGRLEADRMLDRVAEIVAVVAVPVSADLEAGYGDTTDEIGRTVAAAVERGAAGGNLEDAIGGALLDVAEAVDGLVAAREAAPTGTFVLNARTDAYLVDGVDDPFAVAVERANQYVAAGADCVFVPGVDDAETIRQLAAEIPAPLNVVAGLAPTVIDPAALFELGVRRVSLGGTLARVAYGALERAATELRDAGTLGFVADAIPFADMQRRFAEETRV